MATPSRKPTAQPSLGQSRHEIAPHRHVEPRHPPAVRFDVASNNAAKPDAQRHDVGAGHPEPAKGSPGTTIGGHIPAENRACEVILCLPGANP